MLQFKWAALAAVLVLIACGAQQQAQAMQEPKATLIRLSQEPCNTRGAGDAGSTATDAAKQPDEPPQDPRGTPELGKTSVEIELKRNGNEINWEYNARGHQSWLIMSATVGSTHWSDTQKLSSFGTGGNVSVPRNVGVDFSAVVDDSPWDYGGGIRIEVSGHLRPGEDAARAGCSL